MAKDKSKTKISARTSPVVSKPKSTIAKTRGWSLDVPSATTPTSATGKKGKGKGKEPMRRSTMPARLMECVDELIGDGRRGDVVIPVIGKTGVGRSTFINTLLDSPLMRVAPSGSCFPCTTSLAYVQLDPSLHPNLPGRRVFIVDTPGLDEVGEDGLLLRLKTWLEKSYWKGMKLGGVIYLHHICERLVVGKMNRVVDEVDGRMVLATSGWDEIVDVETGDGLTVGLGFERELREVWCRDLIGGSGSEEDPPSNMKRFWLSKGSAVEILNLILLSIPPLDVEGFGGGGKRKGVPMKRFKSVWAPMKYPISTLPIPAKGKLLTNNLTPDTQVPNLRSILGTNPSIQRRARLLSPQCHFSYVTPFPIPFPYDIEAPGPEEQEKYENDKGGYIEKWLSEREAVHPRTGGGGRLVDSKGREQPAILLGLSETGLRDCFPHLEVGDSFQLLGVPALSPSDLEGDGKQAEGEKGEEARKELIDVLSGQSVIIDEETGFAPWSMRYSGHQFGSWAGQLGDGRAVSILVSPHPTEPTSYELQLKGSGRTPFSRTADGLAVTRSSIREFLCSEYMQALSIPTTRSLSLISLPSLPVQRESLERGCIMSRMAPSFIRIGNFEALNAPQGMFFFGGGQQKADLEALRILGEWVAGPNVLNLGVEEGKPWGKELVLEVGRRNARMVAKWQVYGFMHGVINTDNVSILGLTIDYGPYAFMDVFDSFHICNHTDEGGRYAYKYQPSMIVFALRKLLASLAPLIGAEMEKGERMKEGWATDVKEEKVEEWKERGMKEVGDELERVVQEEMSVEYARAMRGRLGLKLALPTDETKISKPLLDLMEEHHLDFHSTFRSLSYFKPSYLSSPSSPSSSSFVDLLLKNTPDPASPQSEAYRKAKTDIEAWLKVYSERLVQPEEVKLWTSTSTVEGERDLDEERKKEMLSKNPRFVLRQWVLEEVIKKVEGDVNLAAAAVEAGSGSSPDNLNTGGDWKSRRVLAKVLHMACNPFEPWGGEVDPLVDSEEGKGEEEEEGKKEELSEEEKEERRFCGLGERKYLGFQCSCSS